MTTSRLQGDELIATRRLQAHPSKVWQAFTTAAGVSAFWGGTHATVPSDSVTISLRPGGEFSLDTVAPDGRRQRLTFVYVAITEGSELVYDEPLTGLRTVVRIRPDEVGSLLTVHQSKLPIELQTEQAREGLAAILDTLATHLEQTNNDEGTTT